MTEREALSDLRELLKERVRCEDPLVWFETFAPSRALLSQGDWTGSSEYER
jgi:hypothetical protein